ncbi:MAG: hypothetical protein AB1Z20_11570, partial [Desulfobacterales bacterium]
NNIQLPRLLDRLMAIADIEYPIWNHPICKLYLYGIKKSNSASVFFGNKRSLEDTSRITPTGQPDWLHRFGFGPDNQLLKQTGQVLKKFLPVLAIFKNRFAFDSSDDDMMQRTRGVNAGMTEYAFQIRDAGPLVNKEATSSLLK